MTTLPGCHAQLLMNLVRNSIEHGFVSADEHNITINIHAKKGTYIVDYFDNGVGMSAARQVELLCPSDPLSDTPTHMGLGLSICYRLVVEDLKGQCAFLPSDQGIHFQYQFSSMSTKIKS